MEWTPELDKLIDDVVGPKFNKYRYVDLNKTVMGERYIEIDRELADLIIRLNLHWDFETESCCVGAYDEENEEEHYSFGYITFFKQLPRRILLMVECTPGLEMDMMKPNRRIQSKSIPDNRDFVDIVTDIFDRYIRETIKERIYATPTGSCKADQREPIQVGRATGQ